MLYQELFFNQLMGAYDVSSGGTYPAELESEFENILGGIRDTLANSSHFTLATDRNAFVRFRRAGAINPLASLAEYIALDFTNSNYQLVIVAIHNLVIRRGGAAFEDENSASVGNNSVIIPASNMYTNADETINTGLASFTILATIIERGNLGTGTPADTSFITGQQFKFIEVCKLGANNTSTSNLDGEELRLLMAISIAKDNTISFRCIGRSIPENMGDTVEVDELRNSIFGDIIIPSQPAGAIDPVQTLVDTYAIASFDPNHEPAGTYAQVSNVEMQMRNEEGNLVIGVHPIGEDRVIVNQGADNDFYAYSVRVVRLDSPPSVGFLRGEFGGYLDTNLVIHMNNRTQEGSPRRLGTNNVVNVGQGLGFGIPNTVITQQFS